MIDLIKQFVPLLPLITFVVGDEGGGGDDDKGGDKDGDKSTVSKADYDKLAADLVKTKADLDDMRMEVLTPDYVDYLNTRDDDDKGKKEPLADASTLPDDKIEKMSKKELIEHVRSEARKEFKGELDKIASTQSESEKARTHAEVSAFARSHEDYETFRPIMYGISLDPKNANLTLTELYNAAKEHVKRIHTEPSDEEKKRQAKTKGEKPGADSESLARLKKLNAQEAADEAWEEVIGDGILPSS